MDGDNPNTFQLFYQTVIFNLKNRIGHLPINESNKEKHIKTLDNFDSGILNNIIYSAENKLSTLNVQYIVCFLINMNTKDIGMLFNIQQASIYSVRYRIKKKFPANMPLPF